MCWTSTAPTWAAWSVGEGNLMLKSVERIAKVIDQEPLTLLQPKSQ